MAIKARRPVFEDVPGPSRRPIQSVHSRINVDRLGTGDAGMARDELWEVDDALAHQQAAESFRKRSLP